MKYLSTSSILLIAIFSLTAVAGTPLENPPSRAITLADWGLTGVAEIGYVAISILHQETGDELVVNDVRRSRPVLQEIPGPRGRVPAFEGDYFLVSHFDHGNTNRLGGYFNTFAKAPAQATLSLGPAPDGAWALTFRYQDHPQGFAGFWLHLFDFKEPPSERVYLDASPFTFLTFAVRGEQGGEELELKLADRTWVQKEDAVAMAQVNSLVPSGRIGTAWEQVHVPLDHLPMGLNRQELASLVFLVKGSGRVFIRDLAFTTKKDVILAAAPPVVSGATKLRQALWLWETEKILGNPQGIENLTVFCRQQGITDLFVQIPYQASQAEGAWHIQWDAKAWRAFLSHLHAQAIKVHALDGDRRFALRRWHGRVLAVVQAIVDYNQRAQESERFDGIRYDNEPYLLPAFGGVRKTSILLEYLELLRAMRAKTQAAGLELGVDIPFWFDARNEFYEPVSWVEGRPMSEQVLDIVDNIGIMDYRTVAYGADGVISHATSELQYAASIGKKVFVGLETVLLPDATEIELATTTQKQGSRLLLQDMKDGTVRLVWLEDETWPQDWDPQILKSARFLAPTRKILVPSSKLTFAGKSPRDLQEVVAQAASEFHSFPSFAGFAIHSYESYSQWFQRDGNGF